MKIQTQERKKTEQIFAARLFFANFLNFEYSELNDKKIREILKSQVKIIQSNAKKNNFSLSELCSLPR